MARVRARAVHLHGINTLYHAVSVYTGMHKTLETLETLALRARVSKPVSAVLYIPVYTSTAWYNLYLLLCVYMCIICQLAHSASIAHALAVNLDQLGAPTWFFTLSAADVIQTRTKQWGVLYTDGKVHASFEDKSNWLRSNVVIVG